MATVRADETWQNMSTRLIAMAMLEAVELFASNERPAEAANLIYDSARKCASEIWARTDLDVIVYNFPTRETDASGTRPIPSEEDTNDQA